MSDRKLTTELDKQDGNSFTRRSALIALGTGIASANVAFMAAAAQSKSLQPGGVKPLNRANVNEIVRGGGTLVVAQWEAKEGQAEAVTAILHRFLPQAQNDPGVKLFLIARGKDNPAQFLFYELFVDDAAVAAHRASEYFKTLILGESVPLLSKRESTQYSLL